MPFVYPSALYGALFSPSSLCFSLARARLIRPASLVTLPKRTYHTMVRDWDGHTQRSCGEVRDKN